MIHQLFKSTTAKYFWKSIATFSLFTLVQSIMLGYITFPEQALIMLVLYVISFFTAICIPLWFANIRLKQFLTKATALQPIKYFMGGWLVILTVNTLMLWLRGSETYLVEQPNQKSITLLMDNVIYLIIPLTIFIAPVVEELIFRQWIPKFVRNVGQIIDENSRVPEIVGFIVGSFLFTLMHAPTGLQGWVIYGGLSLVLLGIRLKFTVKASIMMHMYYNAFAMILSLII